MQADGDQGAPRKKKRKRDAGGAALVEKRPRHMRFTAGRSRSYYVFLMYSHDAKKNTCIDVSRNPVRKIFNYNRGTVRHRRGGKSNSHVWRLEQIVGPFDARDEALRYRHAWTRNSRSLRGRAKKGREMALDNALACWDMHVGDEY